MATLNKTEYASKNADELKNRILLTDDELKCLLGVGTPTVQAIAKNANAVVRVNGRKLNSLEKVKKYIDSVSGK